MARLTFEAVYGKVDPNRPVVYLWEVFDASGSVVYRHIGKSKNGATRALFDYERNVQNLLDGRPYRAGNPDGFREVHIRLAEAVRAGEGVRLTFLLNAAEGDLNHAKRGAMQEYGLK